MILLWVEITQDLLLRATHTQQRKHPHHKVNIGSKEKGTKSNWEELSWHWKDETWKCAWVSKDLKLGWLENDKLGGLGKGWENKGLESMESHKPFNTKRILGTKLEYLVDKNNCLDCIFGEGCRVRGLWL